MVRLYRRSKAGWEYWEAWPEPSGQLFVHRGRAGERGVAERVPASVLCAEERLASIDPEPAAEVLSAELEASGLPTEALIAVCAGEDVIHWPPGRRGEPFDAP